MASAVPRTLTPFPLPVPHQSIVELCIRLSVPRLASIVSTLFATNRYHREQEFVSDECRRYEALAMMNHGWVRSSDVGYVTTYPSSCQKIARGMRLSGRA